MFVECDQRLAGRRGVHRPARADVRRRTDHVIADHLVENQHGVIDRYLQGSSLTGLLGEPLQERPDAQAQVVAGQGLDAERHQCRAETVAAGTAVAIDQALTLEGAEKPVSRGLVQSGQLAHLCELHFRLLGREQFQEANRAQGCLRAGWGRSRHRCIHIMRRCFIL